MQGGGTNACSLKTKQRKSSDPPAPDHHEAKQHLQAVTQHQQTKRVIDSETPPHMWQVLLRKEVIQPHLPVRLPCYDFTPIAGPTFDSSLPEGLSHWLRVLPTFVV
jgi:hypothetical protein